MKVETLLLALSSKSSVGGKIKNMKTQGWVHLHESEMLRPAIKCLKAADKNWKVERCGDCGT